MNTSNSSILFISLLGERQKNGDHPLQKSVLVRSEDLINVVVFVIAGLIAYSH
ncbi:MAG TPA: hypothetical protein VH593_32025 [Ktedonobacteraceae bacterium]